MSATSISLHPTPNPNSIKFTSQEGAFIPSGMAVFASPAEAASDPLGRDLFAIEGVGNVLVLPTFVTVTKRPDAEWDRMLTRIEEVLIRHLTR
jgi:hypothetical protein